MSDLHHILFTRRGAVTEAARACSISTAAVSQWRKNGIPPARVEAVAKALGVTPSLSKTKTETAPARCEVG